MNNFFIYEISIYTMLILRLELKIIHINPHFFVGVHISKVPY